MEARNSLSEITFELQERSYRWKQIESLCGFRIINNKGLTYLDKLLYKNGSSGKFPYLLSGNFKKGLFSKLKITYFCLLKVNIVVKMIMMMTLLRYIH